MAVLRVVPYLAAAPVDAVASFYQDVLGFEGGFDDLPRITVPTGSSEQRPEIIVLTHEIIPSAPIPHLLVEVDDVDDAHDRAVAAGHDIVYPLTDEAWDVRRFFVVDPGGRVVNVLGRRGDA